MNKKKNLVFFLILILLVNCSFDTKTGIWSGEENEKKKVVELEKEQIKKKNIKKIYSIGDEYSLEKTLTKKIILSEPKKNSSWQMSGLNHQNFLILNNYRILFFYLLLIQLYQIQNILK